MSDQKSLITICETNPVLRLLAQRNRHYPLEIIHRLFRGEYTNEAPLEAFLSVCAVVREELQMHEGGGNYLTPPAKQLEIWCDGRETEPWFTLVGTANAGRLVGLRPAARRAFAFAVSTDDVTDTTSGEAMMAFFRDIAAAAAHLRQDADSTLQRLKAEIEERTRQIAEIETKGLVPATDEDRERYASNLTQSLSEITITLNNVPVRLRENIREAREMFYEIEGSHGAVLDQVIGLMTTERRSRGYRTLEALNAIGNQPHDRDRLQRSLEIVIEECGAWMTPRQRQEAGTLFSSLSDISMRILSEDHFAVCQVANFVESDTFERRRGQSRLLMELVDAMRSAAPVMRIRRRGPSELPGFRLGAERDEGVKIHWFDLKLGATPPVRDAETIAEVPRCGLDREQAAAAARAAAAKGAWLDAKRLSDWIGKVVRKNGPTPLSMILSTREIRYGLDEVAAFVDQAVSKVPAEFRAGWNMDVAFRPEQGTATKQALVLRAPDPVFLPEGVPGIGLSGVDLGGRSPGEATSLVAALRAQAGRGGGEVLVSPRRPERRSVA